MQNNWKCSECGWVGDEYDITYKLWVTPVCPKCGGSDVNKIEEIIRCSKCKKPIAFDGRTCVNPECEYNL